MTEWQAVRADERIELAGELRLADGAAIWRTLDELARVEKPSRLDLDLDRVQVIDGAVAALLVEYRAALAARSIPCELVGGGPAIRSIVHLYRGDRPPAPPSIPPPQPGVVVRVGDAVWLVGQRVHQAVAFVGELVLALAYVARHPRRGNWRSIGVFVERAGADGLVIVLVLNFLIGFVIAYQSIPQLELFGANIFVADVVGVAVTRELAPLMTAIIVTGRSGAAFAAELGTMRVSDEIDALRTMGFSPMVYLVLPRVWALAIAAPVLTLAADAAGCFGGLVVGAVSLEVTPRGYLTELQLIVVYSDVWTGLIKSFAFAVAIALVGCQQGLAARGAAAGVGRGTTTTVVASLFAIVVIDTVFTIVFRMAGV